MAKNPLYGQNKSDLSSGSAFVTVGVSGLQSAGQRYVICPIDGKLSAAYFLVTTAVTTAASAITFKDCDENTIGTGSIPVTAVNKGVIVAEKLDGDADAAMSAGDVVEVEYDGGSAAGAGDLVLQFCQ